MYNAVIIKNFIDYLSTTYKIISVENMYFYLYIHYKTVNYCLHKLKNDRSNLLFIADIINIIFS